MLRYYEQAGLIQSLRRDGYAYRVYDETAMSRLRQIIVLRKLRVPIRQIVSILSNADAAEAVEIFRQNINDIDEEITALSTIKSILMRFVEEIDEKADVKLRLLDDGVIFHMISSLSFSDNQIRETKERLSMEELDKANEELMKLEDRDIRIVYLPPMTVAIASASGEGGTERASDIVNTFIKESGLLKIKPDARCFDFDYSEDAAKPSENPQRHETWVSIPDTMEIPSFLEKRQFAGGLYAAHVLRAWDFEDWRRFRKWVDASENMMLTGILPAGSRPKRASAMALRKH